MATALGLKINGVKYDFFIENVLEFVVNGKEQYYSLFFTKILNVKLPRVWNSRPQNSHPPRL